MEGLRVENRRGVSADSGGENEMRRSVRRGEKEEEEMELRRRGM